MNSYPSPKHGHCARCSFVGEVSINSDYEYLCPPHMNLYIKMHRNNSRKGTVMFLESSIKRLERELEETKAKLPDAVCDAIQARDEYAAAREAVK